VARTVFSRYEDGVWLVELAPIADPMLVPQQVAKTVGVQESTAADPTLTGALIRFLQNRQVLLVLDNCEHQLDACARLVDDLVHSCEHLRVLATSREALGLTGEVAWRMPSLQVPDAHQQLTLQEHGMNPAVQLFVDRATALLGKQFLEFGKQLEPEQVFPIGHIIPTGELDWPGAQDWHFPNGWHFHRRRDAWRRPDATQRRTTGGKRPQQLVRRAAYHNSRALTCIRKLLLGGTASKCFVAPTKPSTEASIRAIAR
jgi:hypothetical protein